MAIADFTLDFVVILIHVRLENYNPSKTVNNDIHVAWLSILLGYQYNHCQYIIFKSGLITLSKRFDLMN